MIRKSCGFVVAILFLALGGVGCSSTTDQPQDLGKTAAELSILNCQMDAQECVFSARSTDDLLECRGGFESCIGEIDLPTPLEAIECATDAAQCLADGGKIRDCRAAFDGCVDELLPDINLPELPELPEIPGLPEIPELPGPAGAINCAQDAADCILDGASILDCRESFNACVGELIPELPELPELPGELPGADEINAARDCAATAIDCLREGGNVLACRIDFDKCIVELVPDDLIPEIPGLDAVIDRLQELPDPQAAVDCAVSAAQCVREGEGVLTCRDAFEECIGAIIDELPEIPVVVPGLPVEIPEELTACLSAAQDCLLGRLSVAECRAVFEECAGQLPETVLAGLPELR